MVSSPYLPMSVALIFLAACATITKGADQTVTVISDPPGAKCSLKRDGSTLGVIDSAPNSIRLEKAGKPINIVCNKKGFETATGILSAKFQDMALGNIFFGGLIGAVVDAGSGAANQYPETITVILIPKVFVSEQQRDSYFDKLKRYRTEVAKQRIKQIRENCSFREDGDCGSQVKKLEASRDADLASYESKRQNAVIDQIKGQIISQ